MWAPVSSSRAGGECPRKDKTWRASSRQSWDSDSLQRVGLQPTADGEYAGCHGQAGPQQVSTKSPTCGPVKLTGQCAPQCLCMLLGAMPPGTKTRPYWSRLENPGPRYILPCLSSGLCWKAPIVHQLTKEQNVCRVQLQDPTAGREGQSRSWQAIKWQLAQCLLNVLEASGAFVLWISLHILIR